MARYHTHHLMGVHDYKSRIPLGSGNPDYQLILDYEAACRSTETSEQQLIEMEANIKAIVYAPTPEQERKALLDSLDEMPVVVAYRYGAAPSEGRSYNYRDGYYEAGISVAWVEGLGELAATDACIAPFPGRITRVEGRLLRELGTDGEFLVSVEGYY